MAAEEDARAAAVRKPTYVGSASCQECHKEAYEGWKTSHHALAERAIDPAMEAKAFRGKGPIRHGSLTSTVREEAGAFEIVTLGADGAVKPHRVERVIGEAPLRQYMIPARGGRYQVAALSYDPAKDEWFDVFGEEDRKPHEWGYWSNRGMTWNSVCADCHNTNLRKHYDVAADSYETTYAELGVGCEACHGPSSAHVKWQEAHEGEENDPTIAGLVPFQYPDVQVDTCGPCHARRVELREDYEPGDLFLNSFRMEVPDHTDIYYPDGQVRGENYEYTSFLMSRMYANGIGCANCHDPHSGKRWFEGNRLCLNCHRSRLPVDPAEHSHHDVNDTGGVCINCHMPITTYMQRHPRHDHGLTIPDPLLTKTHGIPNACNRCHKEETVDWAIEAVEKWYGSRMDRTTRGRTRLMARARANDESVVEGLIGFIRQDQADVQARAAQRAREDPSEARLVKVQGPIWRAIAAGFLRAWVHRSDVRKVLIELLSDEAAVVRTLAASALEGGGPQAEAALAEHVDDPVRAVRIAAAWGLRRGIDSSTAAGRDLQAYLGHNADQPPGVMMQAVYCLDRGEVDGAISLLRKAMGWEARSAVLHHSLAVALSTAGQAAEAAVHCEKACELSPKDASLWYSLGLARAELGQTQETVRALEKACALDENFSRAWYNLGLAKNAVGDREGAIRAMRRATVLVGDSADYWYALATVYRDAGRIEKAKEAAREALRVNFAYGPAEALLKSLEKGE